MSAKAFSKIFVIGGSGAQGTPVVQGLVADGRYSVLALTRDRQSRRAQALARLGDVAFLEGTFADEAALREGFGACDAAFVNIDGFNSGEKAETYWAIRAYELAIEAGVKFFVYGNLDYVTKISGYDPKFRCGHYDGKGRMGEWVLAQTAANGGRMGAALFTTGPYMEMTLSQGTPMTPAVIDGALTWRVPLGSGAVPHVALKDCGHYVRWLFDNAERASGMNLEVAIEPVRYADLAAAFERVTGHPARYVDVPLEAYWNGPIRAMADLPAGYNADPADKATMTIRKNFTGFWNSWKHEIVTRDYALLDEIHPGRIRSAEDWLRRADEAGKAAGRGGLWERMQPDAFAKQPPVLKLSEDRRQGRL